jgi:hypothetical protein
MIKKYKFDHSVEDFFSSVGFSENKDKIGDYILEIFKKHDKKSAAIEAIINSDLSEHEKYISLFVIGKMYGDLKLSAIKKMFEDFNDFISDV